ncbi:hypothetical protein TBLA_0E04430 [Henningerozyma blattae CBS 6284]|uniref:Uncharacterized protein n=1 Tax=Henningerozyma blattae (strain ATCC 34711 / CBS 6284 / DSM 70876 / NBRC 10599 / NRRL Y-10934 / UCD 77-7) TaxID=1071380 RepID=I2H545_HENB6|nr:hypothetical protein TBLA_0E04430 [Tetrapisispora blattae CBS 6284]CCH61497.1 hypothetical protein TBLA_0E04430 [Tetrapisispora blattae CBS 6284]
MTNDSHQQNSNIQDLKSLTPDEKLEMLKIYNPKDLGISYTDYLDEKNSNVNIELLEKGYKDMQRYHSIKAAVLTQEYCDMLNTGTLSPENIIKYDTKLTNHSKALEKYNFTSRRYYLNEDNNIIDKRKPGRIICEPKYMYDIVIAYHLKLHSSYAVSERLKKFFSNVGRQYIDYCAKYCSKCFPDETEHMKLFTDDITFKNIRNNIIDRPLFPMERIHIEIFNPFDDLKIENKYQRILYIRDYSTRYIWTFTLKKLKLKHITNILTEFFLSIATNVPIFLQSSTIDNTDLFDICEKISREYHISLGLGTNNKHDHFHLSGIEMFKQLVNLNKSKCLKSWSNFLVFGSVLHNNKFNSRILSKPIDIINCNNLAQGKKKFRDRRLRIIKQTITDNYVKLGNVASIIFIEDEATSIAEGLTLEGNDKYEQFSDEYRSDIDVIEDDSYDIPLSDTEKKFSSRKRKSRSNDSDTSNSKTKLKKKRK